MAAGEPGVCVFLLSLTEELKYHSLLDVQVSFSLLYRTIYLYLNILFNCLVYVSFWKTLQAIVALLLMLTFFKL